jgi:subfamily B ATP-binding cassette protein MsbA
MKNARLLLKFFAPYRWSATMTIIYNILSAIFGLLTFALIQPFLNVLFMKVATISEPGSFHFTKEYISKFTDYYLSVFVQKEGQAGALMLVVLIVIGASFFKNTFVFLSNNRIAFIRASTVRDIRKKLYNKILSLPLSFFTDSRKGDVMTRISNDVQEIEISVINSLTMLIRDPITVIMYVGFLFVVSYRLSLFAMVLLPLSGWLIGMAGRTLRSASLQGQQNLGRLLSIVEETLTGLRIIKGFNAENIQKGNQESIPCFTAE